MKMSIKLLTAMILLTLGLTASAYASDLFESKPMPIDLAYNPISMNGTYDIDRLVIREGDRTVLDSEDDYSVRDDKGEATVVFNQATNTIDVVFKMQMSGSVFQKGSALAKYAFIYEKRSLTLPAGGEMLERINKAGMSAYDHDEIVIELPFETGRKLILLLDKETDKVIPVSNSKYLFL